MPSAQALIPTFSIIENVLSFSLLLPGKSDEGENGRGYEISCEKGFSICTMRAKS